LLIALAACFAALSYAGFLQMRLLNKFFKQIAATAGVLFIIIAVYNLIAKKTIIKRSCL
jgi:hypothetical protein